MFTTLHTLAQASPVQLLAVAEGDVLRLTLQPLPAGKGAVARPALVLAATPAEFERDFEAALAAWQAPPAKPLVEQASAAAAEAATETAAADEKKAARSTAAKKAAQTKAEKAAEAERLKKERAEKAAATRQAKKAAAEKAKAEADAKRAHARAAKAQKAAAPPPADTPAASPADERTAVIADARAYLAAIGTGKPSRVAFIKSAPTGRRYERLGFSFEGLITLAQQRPLFGPPPAEAPAETNAHTATESLHAGEPTVHAGGEKLHAGGEKLHAGDEKLHTGETNPRAGEPNAVAPETGPETGADRGPAIAPEAAAPDTLTPAWPTVEATGCTTAEQAQRQSDEAFPWGTSRERDKAEMAAVSLRNLTAPPADATAGLFQGAPTLDAGKPAPEPAPPAPLTLNLI